MNEKCHLSSSLSNTHKRIVALVSKYKLISRAKISQLTGLTPGTITQNVKLLVNLGLVRETGRQKNGRGQPSILLEINPQGAFSIGIGFEPNFIGISISNLQGIEVFYDSIDTNHAMSLFDTLIGVKKIIAKGISKIKIPHEKVIGLGVSIPAYQASNERWVCIQCASLFEQINDVNFQEVLESTFSYPIHIANNANSSVIGEYYLMPKNKYTTLVYVDIGFGIGAGIIHKGKLFKGGFNNSGQIGLSFPYNTERPTYTDFMENKDQDAWVTRCSRQLETSIFSCIQWIDPQIIIIGGSLPDDVNLKLIATLSTSSFYHGDDGPRPLLVPSSNMNKSSTFGASIIPFYNEFYR